MNAKQKAPKDEEIPLTEHIIELRNRLTIVIATTLTIAIITYPFSKEIALWVWSSLLPPGTPLTAYSPLEWIISRITLSVIIGLFIGIPVLVYEMFSFASKGLYAHEKKFIIKIIPLSALLFLTGAVIAYLIVLPIFFNTVITQTQDIAQTQLSIKHTFDIIAIIIAGFGTAFQFPLFIILAIKMKITTRESLRKKRIIVYGLLLTFAMIIAPDPTSIAQLILAITLSILFEISLQIARII